MVKEKMSSNAALASFFGQALASDVLACIFISELDRGHSFDDILRTLRFFKEAGPEDIGKFVAENREFMDLFEAERRRIYVNYERVFDRAIVIFEAAKSGKITIPSNGVARYGFFRGFEDIGEPSSE